MKSANVFFAMPAERPWFGSPAVVNAYLEEALAGLGYSLHRTYGRVGPLSVADHLPLAVPERLAAVPTADLSLYCDAGVQLHSPRRREGGKNVVFFHGLMNAPALWLGNPEVDRFWANSPYLKDVLRSLLAMPDWRERRVFDPRAFGAIDVITMPFPWLDHPQGVLVAGAPALPPRVAEALAGDDLVGHSVMYHKPDLRALAGILLALNRLARERRLRKGLRRRRFRLLVSGQLVAQLKDGLAAPAPHLAHFAEIRDGLKDLGLALDDLFVPVPPLAQSALFQAMRACRFGLLYNWVPESFGFYPLESVAHECPVYTNGVGNVRHSLPAGHGVHVVESEAMAFGGLSAFGEVAERIYRDTVEAPEAAREECRRGLEHARRTYTREALARDLEAALRALEAPPPPAPRFEELSIGLGPLVRLWNPASRRVVSDLASRELTTAEATLVGEVVGKSCGEVRPADGEIEVLQGLFREGVLALEPPRLMSP